MTKTTIANLVTILILAAAAFFFLTHYDIKIREKRDWQIKQVVGDTTRMKDKTCMIIDTKEYPGRFWEPKENGKCDMRDDK